MRKLVWSVAALVLATGCGSHGGGGSASSGASGTQTTQSSPGATSPTSTPSSSSSSSLNTTPIAGSPAPSTPAASSPAVPAGTHSGTPGANPSSPPTTASSGSTTSKPSDPHLAYALDAINASRAALGAPPLLLDLTVSSCALRHAQDVFGCAGGDIGQFSSCAHGDFRAGDTCNSLGENQGVAMDPDQDAGFQAIHDSMMGEGPPPAGTINHWWNLTNPNYTTVGIGLYVDANGVLWVSEEFR